MTNRTHIPLPNLGLGGFVENGMRFDSDPQKPVVTFSKKNVFSKMLNKQKLEDVIWQVELRVSTVTVIIPLLFPLALIHPVR